MDIPSVVCEFQSELTGALVALIETRRRLKGYELPPEDNMVKEAIADAARATNSCVYCLTSLKDGYRTVDFNGEGNNMCIPCYEEHYPTPDFLPQTPMVQRRVAFR